MDKNFCFLVLILLAIYLLYQVWKKNAQLSENMNNLDKELSLVDDKPDIENAVEISKLTTIKEPILIKYRTNTNHITNTKNSLVHKITHPSRFRFKFNNNRFNLYELRIIKSERLVVLGEPFDLEIHLIHKNDNNIYDTLVIVIPIRMSNNKCDAGLLNTILGNLADIPEKNNFQVYNGKIQTLDYKCFEKYLQGTEICYYNPVEDTRKYLIIQKPVLENKNYVKRIKDLI